MNKGIKKLTEKEEIAALSANFFDPMFWGFLLNDKFEIMTPEALVCVSRGLSFCVTDDEFKLGKDSAKPLSLEKRGGLEVQKIALKCFNDTWKHFGYSSSSEYLDACSNHSDPFKEWR